MKTGLRRAALAVAALLALAPLVPAEDAKPFVNLETSALYTFPFASGYGIYYSGDITAGFAGEFYLGNGTVMGLSSDFYFRGYYGFNDFDILSTVRVELGYVMDSSYSSAHCDVIVPLSRDTTLLVTGDFPRQDISMNVFGVSYSSSVYAAYYSSAYYGNSIGVYAGYRYDTAFATLFQPIQHVAGWAFLTCDAPNFNLNALQLGFRLGFELWTLKAEASYSAPLSSIARPSWNYFTLSVGGTCPLTFTWGGDAGSGDSPGYDQEAVDGE
jgi:hypothetical protein